MSDILKQEAAKNVEAKLLPLIKELNEIQGVHDKHHILYAVIHRLLLETDVCYVEAVGAVEAAKQSFVQEKMAD